MIAEIQGVPKNALSECHSVLAQSQVTGTPCVWKLIHFLGHPVEVLESLKKIDGYGRIAAEGQERQKAEVQTAQNYCTTIAYARGYIFVYFKRQE